MARSTRWLALLLLMTTPAALAAPQAQPAPATSAATPARTGEQIYSTTCMVCHQATGAGLPGAFPPLSASPWVTGDPELPIKVVLHGLSGELQIAGQSYNSVMMAYKDTFSDEEIANVLTHVRSSFGNSASAISPAQVAAVRAATASQVGPYLAADIAPQ